jgi:hypothetical protein
LLNIVEKRLNPLRWVNSHLPRNQAQLETELKGALKIAFWAALLAPVIIVPTYYLLVAIGLLPSIHLPG